MNIFAPGSDITLTFDMLNPQTHEEITPVSASFSVYDEEGTALMENVAVTVSGGEETLDVTVPAANNVISGSNGARTISLIVNTAKSNIFLSETYVLEQFGFLTIPAESAMTLPQSMILSTQMAQQVIDIWSEVEDRERQAALREAWSRISRLPFDPWRMYETPPSDIAINIVDGNFAVNELDKETWDVLPGHFKTALKNAQLIEACVILEGDPTWDRRQEGLISKTVGESSEMFSARKPALTSMSPKSYREIRRYISRTIKVGRA